MKDHNKVIHNFYSRIQYILFLFYTATNGTNPFKGRLANYSHFTFLSI